MSRRFLKKGMALVLLTDCRGLHPVYFCTSFDVLSERQNYMLQHEDSIKILSAGKTTILMEPGQEITICVVLPGEKSGDAFRLVTRSVHLADEADDDDGLDFTKLPAPKRVKTNGKATLDENDSKVVTMTPRGQ